MQGVCFTALRWLPFGARHSLASCCCMLHRITHWQFSCLPAVHPFNATAIPLAPSLGGGRRIEQHSAGGAEAGAAKGHSHVEASLHHCSHR